MEDEEEITVRLMNDRTLYGHPTNISPVAVTIISEEKEYTIPWTSILYTIEKVVEEEE